MNYISLFISFSLFLKVLKIKAHEKYQNLSEEKETRIWIQSI